MTSANTWTVKLDPMGENGTDEKNQVGVGIFLTNGSRKVETTRVAFVRRNSKNVRTPFQRQLRRELEKAYAAMDALNESEMAVSDLRTKLAGADDAHREQVASLLQDAETRRQTVLETMTKERPSGNLQ